MEREGVEDRENKRVGGKENEKDRKMEMEEKEREGGKKRRQKDRGDRGRALCL